MSEYEYDPNIDAMQQWFDQDPLAATTALVAAATQQAATSAAQVTAYQNEAVVNSQISIAAATARQELAEKYSDWREMEPYVQRVIAENPHIIPADTAAVDVKTLRDSLELAYRSGREIAADEAADRRWSEVKAARSGRLDFD